MKKERIHTRKIVVDCYETDGERIVVEGELIDERLFPSMIHARNERREAGPMHRVALTMELSIPELEILRLDTDMPVVPDEGCREVQRRMQQLIGCVIKQGFTNEVRKRLPRTEGCIHLTHLLLAMGSAAIQGIWTLHTRIRAGEAPPLPDTDGSVLLDSCHMWRRGGPFEERIRRRRSGGAGKPAVGRP